MLTAAIVLYQQELEILKSTIDCFLQIPIDKKLYLIDNSEDNSLKKHFEHKEITYLFVGENIGFGKAHNLVLNKLKSKYHLVLNPDVTFRPEVIHSLIQQLKEQPLVSLITPKVVYPDGTFQFVCRKHPTLLDLINRKISFSKKYLSKNQYQNRDLSQPFTPDFIQGCFLFFKTEDFKKLNGFDPRFFLYMEDADLCRTIQKNGKKILYYPKVQITHQHQRASAKSSKLFTIHFFSAIQYFLKWGF